MGEVLKVLVEYKKSAKEPDRIYRNMFGDNDLAVIEIEFDTVEEAAKSVASTFTEDWNNDITEGGWYDVTLGNSIGIWQTIS